ncbi:MAG TPA: CpsD/CapB family tyrosine-protein kinase [Ktedonobacterales bacterium]|nr:CpsD/CapB family tyrosine-protein kinase [Ktedonobacterales bacterium]
MELTRTGSAVLRRIYLLVLGAVFVAAAVYVWSARRPPTYQATAQVVVMLHLGFSITPEQVGLTERLAQNYATRGFPENIGETIHLYIPERTPASILRELKVSAVAGQSLINITGQDASPSVALDMTNRAAIAFVNYYSQQSFAAQAAIVQQQKALQTQLDQINGKITQIQAAIAAAQAKGSDTTALNQQLTALQGQQSQVSGQLASVTKQRSAPQADFWVARQGDVAQRVGADPQKNALFGAGAGLFGGMCVALLLDLLDGTVRKPGDTMRFAGLSTIGSVRPLLSEEDGPALIRREEYATVSGAYEELMRNLAFLGATRSLQMLLIAPSDGVSGMEQVGVNLAITHALAGMRTLLVDANWQSPSVETWLGLPPSNQGLFTCLVAIAQNPAGTFHAVTPTPVDNLFALPVGPLPPNLDDLVQSSLLDQLSAVLRDEFERIVILAPTQLRDTAGRHLAERMDGAVVVARAGATTGRELADVAQALRRANAYLAGAVLVSHSQGRSSGSPALRGDTLVAAGSMGEQSVPAAASFSMPGELPLEAGSRPHRRPGVPEQ